MTQPAFRRALLSLAWLAGVVVFLRWWDLTNRAPGLALWSCFFLIGYVVTVASVRGTEGVRLPAERWRIGAWAALLLAVLVGHALIPTVQIRDAVVHTVVFVKVVDTVVPLWIVVRALVVLWTGAARVLVLGGLVPALIAGGWLMVIEMPGRSFGGMPQPLTPEEVRLLSELEGDVRALAVTIGERNHRFPAALGGAAAYVDSVLTAAAFDVATQPFRADMQDFRNLEVTLPGGGAPDEVVVVGAHYDTAEGAPGADDNASGTAALLALARRLHGRRFARTLRLVFFANEEPPFFGGDRMGSRVYAARAAQRHERVVAMLSLETVGYYSDEAGSQRYPFPFNLFYPDRGNFVGFVGNLASRALVRRSIAAFRGVADLPSEGAAAPSWIPGINWSDHASFWLHDYPALMITDTAPFRNPHYHMRTDTADRLDYARMARLLRGLEAVVADLAGS